METKLKLHPADVIETGILYRNLIGELLYISTGTRPDITFCVNYLSRFQNCYNNTHYKYALRILKCLYVTKNLKLIYRKDFVTDILDCLVDSDWAGDATDATSTSGYLIRLFGNSVFWKTRKQGSVAKSSTFAEYVAMSEAITEVNFIRELIDEAFDIKIDRPVKVYEDNLGAVIITKNGNYTKRAKFITIQYHFVHDKIRTR